MICPKCKKEMIELIVGYYCKKCQIFKKKEGKIYV